MKSIENTNSITDFGGSLKKKVLIGSFWLYILQGLSTGLLIVQTIILARLLTPEHFGIVGVFLIFSGALESFTQTGFRKALVQRKNVDSNFLDTAWTISIVRGIILFSVVFFGSSLVVEFFNTPKALLVIKVLGFNLLLQGFYNTGTIYFTRDLAFFKQFLWKSSGFLANFLISIPLAFILRNEWAIVWGMLTGSIVEAILSFRLHPYRPKFRFRFDVFRKLFNYGKWLLLSSAVIFFSRQGDKIFVVKLLGETLLGVYVIAWRIARVPELLTKPVPNALFPAYSKLQDNPKVLKERYKQTLGIIGLFYIPLVGVMIVLARPFITIFLGEKWTAATFPMQILTLSIGINIIISTSHSIFLAMGKTSFNFKINCTRLLTLSIFIYPLVRNYGVEGAALCYLIIALAGFIVWKVEISRLVSFGITDLSCILFPILNTIFVSSLISYMGHWFNLVHPGVLICAITLVCIVYLSIGLILKKVTGINCFHDLVIMLSIFKSMKKIKRKYVV